MLHVYANLMCSSCLQHTFHKRHISKPFQNLIVRHGMLSLIRVSHYSHLHSVFRITSYVARYCSFVLFHYSPHQCVVFTFCGLIVELHSKTGLRIRCFGYNQQSGRILVYSMHQSHLRIVRIVCRNVSQMPCNSIDQGAMIIAASRMYHKSCRLVYHHKFTVLVNNVKWNIFRNNVVVIFRTVHHHRQYIQRFHLIAAFHRFSISHNEPRIRSSLYPVS